MLIFSFQNLFRYTLGSRPPPSYIWHSCMIESGLDVVVCSPVSRLYFLLFHFVCLSWHQCLDKYSLIASTSLSLHSSGRYSQFFPCLHTSQSHVCFCKIQMEFNLHYIQSADRFRCGRTDVLISTDISIIKHFKSFSTFYNVLYVILYPVY